MTIFWLPWYLLVLSSMGLFFSLFAGTLVMQRTNPNMLLTVQATVRNLSGSIIRQAPKLARAIFCAALLVIGYQYRDITAYGKFTERNPANWTILNESEVPDHPELVAHDIQLPAIDPLTQKPIIIRNVRVCCRPDGLHSQTFVWRAGYYSEGDYISFRGPRAYIVKEH